MAYQFGAVDICAFDFHLMLNPLIGGTPTKATASFLVDPATYNQHYYSGLPLQTPKLKFSPLRWRALNYHHFWKYYQTIWVAGANYDFWKLQMPFISQPDIPIRIISGSANFTGSARPVIFLNGIGWSTNLDIKLRGQMTSDELRDFIGQLSNKTAAFFEIAGKRMTLPEVFEYFGDLVLGSVYEPKSIDSIKLKRHLVMALSEFSGPMAHYPADQVGAKRIARGDRASLHAILLGAPVSFDEVLDLEQNKFLLTQFFAGPDFAITHFEKGTLLFMQQSATSAAYQNRALRSKMRCHLSNIRNYLLMTLDLYHFCLDTKNNAAINASTKALRADLVSTIQGIPKKYTNQFCQSFHNHFGPLKKL